VNFRLYMVFSKSQISKFSALKSLSALMVGTGGSQKSANFAYISERLTHPFGKENGALVGAPFSLI
jgi:hypothetical protein